MRLIDADALIARWDEMSVRGRTEFDQEIMVALSFDIVCCEECKHSDGKPIADGRYWCNMYGGFMRYCSEGERRNDE